MLHNGSAVGRCRACARKARANRLCGSTVMEVYWGAVGRVVGRQSGEARSGGEWRGGGCGDGGGNGRWVGRRSPLRVSALDTSVLNSEDGTVMLVAMT